MKLRFTAFLLSICLLLSAVPFAGASAFTDIREHWARDYIEDVTEAGLFYGTSQTLFSPNTSMTRGMFITVLGRLEGIDTEYWMSDHIYSTFTDVHPEAYYAPHVAWAFCQGIVHGVDDETFSPETLITREQMAKMVAFYLELMGHSLAEVPQNGSDATEETTDVVTDPTDGGSEEDELPPDLLDPQTETEPTQTDDEASSPREEEDSPKFPEAKLADRELISSWAVDSVDMLCHLGILSGSPNKDGSLSFHPQDTATRAECATVFSRLMARLQRNPNPADKIIPVYLECFDLTVYVGSTRAINVNTEIAIPKIFWVSSAPDIASVDDMGNVTAHMPGNAVITAYSTSGHFNTCYITCETPIEPAPPQVPDNLIDYSYTEKCMLLFGEKVDDPRLYYQGNKEAALADMVLVKVRTWDFASKNSEEKITRTWTLQVHKNLAEIVELIFEEIYNGEEKFPIHYLGGFSWSAKSEHSIGTAIDINYMENYYCMPDGTPITGTHWKPGEDPYSITPGGDLYNAFIKYGFEWGINWSSGKKDYMHFSFFGT